MTISSHTRTEENTEEELLNLHHVSTLDSGADSDSDSAALPDNYAYRLYWKRISNDFEPAEHNLCKSFTSNSIKPVFISFILFTDLLWCILMLSPLILLQNEPDSVFYSPSGEEVSN